MSVLPIRQAPGERVGDVCGGPRRGIWVVYIVTRSQSGDNNCKKLRHTIPAITQRDSTESTNKLPYTNQAIARQHEPVAYEQTTATHVLTH